jgi:hypothetical protein
MNIDIIKEVLQSMDIVNSRTYEFDINLKSYSISNDILINMLTDELKFNSDIKFGNHNISNNKEIYFAISSKFFKNFQFENSQYENDNPIFGNSSGKFGFV